MGQIVNILSQSDIVRFLIPKMDNYTELFDQTVQECGLATRPPLTVRDTDLTIKALKLMHSQRVSALAVVDEEGRLVGNFSASDLKVREI
jgi:5'-AMP-activated protein kinase, regulatory gamma subunit